MTYFGAALAVFVSLAGPLLASDSGRASPKPKIVVMVPRVANCKCTYDVLESPAMGNNACVSVTLVLNATPQPTCFIQDVCSPQVDCRCTYTLDVKIVDWPTCCASNMLTCANGNAHTTIPQGFTGNNPHTLGGTSLACQSKADSSELPAATDVFSVRCGNSCAVAAIWAATYRETCIHCDG